MSSMYIRIQKDTPSSKMYGFQKLHWDDIKMITSRMQKHTFNSRLGLNEMAQCKATQGRPSHSSPSPVTCDRQRKVKHRHAGSHSGGDYWQGYQLQHYDSDQEDDDSNLHSDQMTQNSLHSPPSASSFTNRKMSKKNIDRIVNRLYSTPTLSSALAASGVGYYCDVTNMDPVAKYAITKPRPKSAPVPSGSAGTLLFQRPTTAYRGKQVGSCQFCDDDKTDKSVFERNYSDDKVYFESELEEIVERIRTPTHASEGGIPKCKKSTPFVLEHKVIAAEPEPKSFDFRPRKKRKTKEEPLPLISGLRRSANVSEIVNRLYTPQKRTATACTPVSYPTAR
ncbi:uncharacterized protein LOC106158420 [Lingula anatina]|uniref:Uncharacterized protein LOC106158420 n=1 Tax=Lingula anatina TaxID=7574 RepID=A0A1S3HWA2_LINAN|nr:uncharacterized protein LOC106158420 [Lingula anatina]|eukprot:XP_013389826.1 uncharacterized protein LOC106158420 [Lingula anatina]